MKRDLDLVREILLLLEDHPEGSAPAVRIGGRSQEEIDYHCYLIVEANLANGTVIKTLKQPSPRARLFHLNNAGHDFLANTRDPTIWEKTKSAMQKTGSTSIEIAIKVAAEVATRMALAAT
ncbi:MAG: DUF2513 domain-containing protein [Planctomycetota bacterium]